MQCDKRNTKRHRSTKVKARTEGQNEVVGKILMKGYVHEKPEEESMYKVCSGKQRWEK
jgi:hypothetical protein